MSIRQSLRLSYERGGGSQGGRLSASSFLEPVSGSCRAESERRVCLWAKAHTVPCTVAAPGDQLPRWDPKGSPRHRHLKCMRTSTSKLVSTSHREYVALTISAAVGKDVFMTLWSRSFFWVMFALGRDLLYRLIWPGLVWHLSATINIFLPGLHFKNIWHYVLNHAGLIW